MTDAQDAKPNSIIEDITDIFDHYRVAVMTMWNTAFWPDPDFRNWDSLERFDEIQRLIFGELVLGKVGRKWPLRNVFENAIPFFQIIPSSETPIMIQNPRPEAATGYWDHPVNKIKPGQAELLFIAYFDWDQMDYADLRYYRVKVVSFVARPELVGREALIERQHCAVHLVNE